MDKDEQKYTEVRDTEIKTLEDKIKNFKAIRDRLAKKNSDRHLKGEPTIKEDIEKRIDYDSRIGQLIKKLEGYTGETYSQIRKRLALTKSTKTPVTFDLDMFYKGTVVYPVDFWVKTRQNVEIEAYKDENGKVCFSWKNCPDFNHYQSANFTSVEDLLKEHKRYILETYGAKKLRDISIGNPYIN